MPCGFLTCDKFNMLKFEFKKSNKKNWNFKYEDFIAYN